MSNSNNQPNSSVSEQKQNFYSHSSKVNQRKRNSNSYQQNNTQQSQFYKQNQNKGTQPKESQEGYKHNNYKNNNSFNKKTNKGNQNNWRKNTMNLEEENEIFESAIKNLNSAKEDPLYEEDNDQLGGCYYDTQNNFNENSFKNYSSRGRKNSSNLPTNNNSQTQTPKTSIDLTKPKGEENKDYLSDFNNPKFMTHIVDKVAALRKFSLNSNYSTDCNEEPSSVVSPPIFFNSAQKKAETYNNFKTKYKTELCKYYEINGTCKFGANCAYAHGKENLRAKVTKASAYRTKKCIQFFEKGFCPYGSRCQFAHALKNNIINNPYDADLSYSKTMEILSKEENYNNIRNMTTKERLPVFMEITTGTECSSPEEEWKLINQYSPNKSYGSPTSTPSTLFEDIKQLFLSGDIFKKCPSSEGKIPKFTKDKIKLIKESEKEYSDIIKSLQFEKAFLKAKKEDPNSTPKKESFIKSNNSSENKSSLDFNSDTPKENEDILQSLEQNVNRIVLDLIDN
ncbi:MAG: zinc finger CCCH domain-containing protein [archaeon]|nr:zinc finger CCCH domain-containing protein [archaeon]